VADAPFRPAWCPIIAGRTRSRQHERRWSGITAEGSGSRGHPMGMDFVALMKYGGPDERLLRVLDRLEAGSPAEVQALTRLMRERGFATGHEATAVWEFMYRTDLRDPRLGRRPRLPSLAVALHLPEDFFLTFGPDAIEVYHLLRWHFFLTEPDLQ